MTGALNPQPTVLDRVRDLLLLSVVSALCFCWRMGHLPFIDPDEPFYALTSREMLEAREWIVPLIFGHPQFEKPPMVYWGMITSMKAFGVTEAAARLPMAVAAIALVFAVYAFGVRHFGRHAGIAAALVLATGVEFMVTSRLVLTDTIFALFTSLSCFAFWNGATNESRRRIWWLVAMVCSGLAVVTKGPLGMLVPGLAALVAVLNNRAPRRLDWVTLAIGGVLFAAVAFPWYALMTQRFGTDYLRTFLVHENFERLMRAEHRENDTFYYYLLVLVVGSLPWLPAVAAAVARARSEMRRDGTTVFLWGWLVANVAFFMVAHSKLPTYILFSFVPLALLAGRAIAAQHQDEPGLARTVKISAISVAVVQAIAFAIAANVPMLAPLRVPIAGIAALLSIGVVLLWLGHWRAWAASTLAASLVLLVGLLTVGTPFIESRVSTRDAAAVVLANRKPGEALLAERFLVRGLTYYSRQTPDVLAGSPRPYFSPHPLPIIVGPEGLANFIKQHPSTLCLIETRAWKRFAAGVSPGDSVTRLLEGDKSLFRIESASSRQSRTP